MDEAHRKDSLRRDSIGECGPGTSACPFKERVCDMMKGDGRSLR